MLYLRFFLSFCFLLTASFAFAQNSPEASQASKGDCGCVAYAESATGSEIYYALGDNCGEAKKALREELQTQSLSSRRIRTEQVDDAEEAQMYIRRRAKRVERTARQLRS